MSSKSKKNRRSIPQSSKEPGSYAVRTNPISDIQDRQSRETPVEATYKRGSVNTAYEVSNDMSFIKDLKWIGLVAAIVIALLITAYYVFR